MGKGANCHGTSGVTTGDLGKSDPALSPQRQGPEAIRGVAWLPAQGAPEQAKVTV